jgi:dihydroneopterin aldolase
MNLEYTDIYGRTQPITAGHMRELIDRLHCMQTILEEICQNHPASSLVAVHLELAQAALGNAYQQAGRIEYDNFGE